MCLRAPANSILAHLSRDPRSKSQTSRAQSSKPSTERHTVFQSPIDHKNLPFTSKKLSQNPEYPKTPSNVVVAFCKCPIASVRRKRLAVSAITSPRLTSPHPTPLVKIPKWATTNTPDRVFR